MSDYQKTSTQSFTHLDQHGQARMVDVSDKGETQRTAVAEAKVKLGRDIIAKVRNQTIAKGDLLATARIAGIQASKKCSELIPLCHPLPLHKVTIDFEIYEDESQAGLLIRSLCKTVGKTGVEMEALTAVSVAALTVYDMCKALDKGVVIECVRLLEKSGGKSGNWKSA